MKGQPGDEVLIARVEACTPPAGSRAIRAPSPPCCGPSAWHDLVVDHLSFPPVRRATAFVKRMCDLTLAGLATQDAAD
jgi:hypothetical protein